MLKHDIINLLGKKFNFNSYLEIGSVTNRHIYNKIDNKIFNKSAIFYIPDIDPTKYEYHHNRNDNDKTKYDIVFVDSWHSYEQSLFDLERALKFVSANGIIVVHKCCPYSEETIGPYKKGLWFGQNEKELWAGQTYEVFVDFRYQHTELEIFCLFVDYGCGIISLKPRFHIEKTFEEYDKNKIGEWSYFNLNKTKLLNLVEFDEFIKIDNIYE